MNTLAINTIHDDMPPDIAVMFAGYPGHIDEVFVLSVHGAADALPVNAPDFTDAFTLGKLDAYENEPCVPQQYYVDLLRCRQYARGHESVAGQTLLSRQWLWGDEGDGAIECDYPWIREGGA